MTGEFETLIKTDIMVLSACLFSAGDHDICAAAGSQNRLLRRYPAVTRGASAGAQEPDHGGRLV